MCVITSFPLLPQCFFVLESRAGRSTLEESTYGVVFVTSGGAKPVQSSRNFFSCKMDPLYLHDGKVLNYTQKPVLVMKWLIELFSCEGDWILDGLSGTGMCMCDNHYVSEISEVGEL